MPYCLISNKGENLIVKKEIFSERFNIQHFQCIIFHNVAVELAIKKCHNLLVCGVTSMYSWAVVLAIYSPSNP